MAGAWRALMLLEPKRPVQTAASIARRANLRMTPLGEQLSAQVGLAFEMTTTGQAIEDFFLPAARRAPDETLADRLGIDVTADRPSGPTIDQPSRARDIVGRRVDFMSKEDYERSDAFREGVEWDERMTPERAQALAEIVDRRAYRESLIERAPGGIARGALSLGAALVGSAPDPANYVPILGQSARAAAVARAGVIAGRAAIGAAEGAIGSALVAPVVASSINRKGGEVTTSDIALDIALSAALGSAFGAGSGVIARRRAARIKARDAKAEVDALSLAVDQMASGDKVDVAKAVAETTTRRRAASAPGTPASVPETPAASPRFKEPDIRTETSPIALIRTTDQEGDVAVDIDAMIDQLPSDVEPGIDLPTTTIQTRRGKVDHRGPLDIVTWARAQGGLVDDGSLKALGIDRNTPGRNVPFADNEKAIGRLFDKKGMTMADAAVAAKRAGYIKSTSPRDLAEAVRDTIDAGDAIDGRVWSRADDDMIERIKRDVAAKDMAGLAVRTKAPDRTPDFSPERADPPPESIEHHAEATKSIETPKVDADDTTIDIEADTDIAEVEAMRSAGELSDQDLAEIEAAREAVEDGEKAAIAYETLAGCVIRHG